MHDIYRIQRSTEPSYRNAPGLSAPTARTERTWTGLVGWLWRLALIVVLGAGLTRLVLEITGG